MRTMFTRALLTSFAGLMGIALSTSANAQAAASDFTTATRYDAMHRVVGTIAPDPDGSGLIHFAAIRNTYDIDGRLIEVEKGELATWQDENTLPSGWAGFTRFQIVDTTYDLLDRKVKEVVSGVGPGPTFTVTPYGVTQYSYDVVGRPECTAVRMNPAVWSSLPTSACTLGTAGSNGPDRITHNVYDDAGQALKVQKAYGVTTANGFPATLQQDYQTYAYTPNGKAAYVIDANGNKSAYGYDGFDRLALWAFPSLTTPGAASTTDFEQYSYDASGNRTQLVKRDGRTINYSYDALNRMTLKAFVGGGACVSGFACTAPPSGAVRDVYYGYDAWGHQTSAKFDSATGSDAATSVYDGFGRLTSSTVAMGGVSRSVGQTYDANGNRIRVTHPDSNYFTYEYDGLDRLVAIKQNGSTQIASNSYNPRGERAASARGAALTSYGYDDVSRLASLADDLSGTSADLSATFAYNPASQITTQGRSNDSYAFSAYTPATTGYVANSLNQYTNVGGGSLGYDSNGNLSANGTTQTFTYDVENRLVAASGTLSTNMVYDAMGRLYQTSSSSGVRQFLYDGDERIGEYDAAGTLLRRYVHGDDEDDPLLWYEGSALTDIRALQSDHQGSIVSVADASGAPIAINTYDEYGVPGSGNIGSFQYTGQAWLPDLGMYYYKARIYSSKLGRFLQTDPIGYKDQMGLYAYVGNDPVDGRDSTGLARELADGDFSGAQNVDHCLGIGRCKVASSAMSAAEGDSNGALSNGPTGHKSPGKGIVGAVNVPTLLPFIWDPLGVTQYQHPSPGDLAQLKKEYYSAYQVIKQNKIRSPYPQNMHPYKNLPDPVSGAILPPPVGRYVTTYVGAGATPGKKRLVIDTGAPAGVIWYSMDHYASFIPFTVIPR